MRKISLAYCSAMRPASFRIRFLVLALEELDANRVLELLELRA